MELSVGEAKQDGESIFVGIVHDLTARKHTEEQLRQSQKMEIVGQLSGGIAHDFNNLLTVMIGNAEHLGDQLKSREDLRRIADDICRSGERGAELTQRLLAFSRRQFLQPLRRLPRTARFDAQAAAADAAGERRDRNAFRSGAVSRLCRSHPARIGGAESGPECAGRHALGRQADAVDRRRHARWSRPGCASGSPGRGLRPDRRDRQRRGHDVRRDRPRVRAVLHHQGSRQGLRPRAEHGLRIRQAVERSRLDLQRAGAGYDGAPLSAVRRRRRFAAARAWWGDEGAAPPGAPKHPGGRGRSASSALRSYASWRASATP